MTKLIQRMKLLELHNIHLNLLLSLTFFTQHSSLSSEFSSPVVFHFQITNAGLAMPFLCKNINPKIFLFIFFRQISYTVLHFWRKLYKMVTWGSRGLDWTTQEMFSCPVLLISIPVSLKQLQANGHYAHTILSFSYVPSSSWLLSECDIWPLQWWQNDSYAVLHPLDHPLSMPSSALGPEELYRVDCSWQKWVKEDQTLGAISLFLKWVGLC